MSYLTVLALGRVSQYDCSLFSPVPTSLGICHAFNAPSVEDTLRKGSRFYDAFVAAYSPDFVPVREQPVFGSGPQETFLRNFTFLYSCFCHNYVCNLSYCM
jgi:hypothetical protein